MRRINVWISVGAIAAEEMYDVRDYGAKPGGKTLCTTSIQTAIDKHNKMIEH